MANNIGYSFEIRYKDSNIKNWLNFQIQDGVILSADKQSGYTESASPNKLKLEASYGTKRANGLKRTADIIFRQNDTNDTKTITIIQDTDQSVSPHSVGDPEMDANNTAIKIFAANNFNFSNIIPFSGGTAYIKAQYIEAWQQKYEETDKYGKTRTYYLPVPADTQTINITDSTAFTSNSDNVTFQYDEDSQSIEIVIGENPTNNSRQIVISASHNGYVGQSPTINQEGTPAIFTFIISTNISGSTAIFRDFSGNSKKIEANKESNGQYKGDYYAEYQVSSTVMPVLYGYVINENCTYSNGNLKLFNEYNNLTKVGGIYTWANASANGDTLQITGLYVGSKNGFRPKKYTETDPLILSGNSADNYIELVPDIDTVSSTTISADVKEGKVSATSISDSEIEITVPKIDNSATTISNDTGTTTSTDNVVKSASSSVEIYSTLDTQTKQLLKIKQISE